MKKAQWSWADYYRLYGRPEVAEGEAGEPCPEAPDESAEPPPTTETPAPLPQMERPGCRRWVAV